MLRAIFNKSCKVPNIKTIATFHHIIISLYHISTHVANSYVTVAWKIILAKQPVMYVYLSGIPWITRIIAEILLVDLYVKVTELQT